MIRNLLKLFTVICFIFVSGCSPQDKQPSTHDVNAIKEVANNFTQALLDRNYNKAYSFISSEYKDKISQNKMQQDFERMVSDSGLRKLKLDSENSIYEPDTAYIILEGMIYDSEDNDIDSTALSLEFTGEDGKVVIKEK